MSDKGPVTPSWLAHEPVVLIQGFVQSVIIAVSAFGLDLTATQTAAISIVTASILSLIVREMVTPLPTAQSAAQAKPPAAVVVAAPAPAPDPAPPAPATSEAPSPEPVAEMPTVTNGGLNV